LVAGLVALATIPLSAQTQPENRDAKDRVEAATKLNVSARKIVLRAKDTVEHTYVRPRVAFGVPADKAFTPATFSVTYTGFSPQAEAAFQAAVDIWSQLISSPVPIRVNAVWEPLGTGVLGSAGSCGLWINVPNGVSGVVYPDALADALAGADQDPLDCDIDASFNSNFTDWYLGTDGSPPTGKFDLVSVVLHELCHGLGFLGSAIVDDGVFEAGVNENECDSGIAGRGCWQLGASFPVIFDQFTEDNLGIALRHAGTYPNDSIALGNVLTGMDIYFDGAGANAGNGGSPPELYAPGTFDYGSSYSHLDETVYGAGHPSSLMTPFVGANEVIHDPGPITLGIFEDIGWEVAGQIFADGFESGDVSRWSSSAP
jgi:hypothetical protein